MSRTQNIENSARREGRALRELAAKLTQDPHDASDLLQDTFERAIRSGRDLGSEDNLHWLITVMRNLFVDRCRKQRAQRGALVAMRAVQEGSTLEVDDTVPSWSGLAPETVTSALQTLEPSFRQAFELRAKGVSLSQISVELGIPTSTVGTRLFRARRKLRAILSVRG